jgi:hypothetical protein
MTPKTLEERRQTFYNDYWNNKIIHLYYEKRSTATETAKALNLTYSKVQRAIHWNERLRKISSIRNGDGVCLGSKKDSYYKNEIEYIIKCEIPLCRLEEIIEIKEEYLDDNYKNFISNENN